MQPHEILGVAPQANLETIKRAYFERAKSLHPDAGGSEKEFVRLHAAYEAMTRSGNPRTHPRQPERDKKQDEPSGRDARRQPNDTDSADGPRTARNGSWSDTADEPGQPSADVLREARERLERETAELLERGFRRTGASMAGFWSGLLLTPLCAAAMATCFCYDGHPPQRAVWTFSFFIAIVILIYTGGMIAALGTRLGTDGPTLYRRTVLLICVIALLIALPWSTLGDPHIRPCPMIHRSHLPDWWPNP